MRKPWKIDVKVMLFFDVTFFRFWSPFGEVLESKMAAKIAVWGLSGHQNAGGQALSRLLKHHDCPKWCLGRAQGRFLSPQASILDGLDSIFSRFGIVFEYVSWHFLIIFSISTSSQIIVFRISIFLTSGPGPNNAWTLNNQTLVIFFVASCIELWNSVKRHHLL